jgi:hypothetical protein
MGTNYQWDLGFGWGRNQSLVESIAGAQFLFTGSSFIGTVAMAGQPLGAIRGLGWIRCGVTPTDYLTDNYPAAAAACQEQGEGHALLDDGTNGCATPACPAAIRQPAHPG